MTLSVSALIVKLLFSIFVTLKPSQTPPAVFMTSSKLPVKFSPGVGAFGFAANSTLGAKKPANCVMKSAIFASFTAPMAICLCISKVSLHFAKLACAIGEPADLEPLHPMLPTACLVKRARAGGVGGHRKAVLAGRKATGLELLAK